MANEKQKARLKRLEAAENMLVELGNDAWEKEHYPDSTVEAAARRLREQKAEREQQERLKKQLAQLRQYEETNRAFIAGIIGEDTTVAEALAAVRTAQATVDATSAELSATIAQLQALNQNAMVDLSHVSMKELLKTAASREKARTVEAAALVAVRDELGRRLADAEAGLAEAQHTLLRRQRVALHQHCDLLIAQLHPLLTVASATFTELYQTQDAIREMGGPRQPLASQSWAERLAWLVERWDTELAEIRKFSEAY